MHARTTHLAAACLAFVALLAWGRTAAEPLPSLGDVVGYFDSVALQVDRGMFGSEGTEPKPVARWEGPVRVHLAGPLTPPLRRRLEWHLERFRLLSGVTLDYVADREDANLSIMLTPSDVVVQRSGSADTLCLTEYEPASGAILWADIFVPVPQGGSDWFDNCVAHELMHAIGFFAHPKDNDSRSILEQGAPYSVRTFTVLDAIGIKMLYDRRLRLALPRDRALPIARIVAAEMLAAWPRDTRTPEPGDPLDAEGFLDVDADALDRLPDPAAAAH